VKKGNIIKPNNPKNEWNTWGRRI